MAGVVFKDVEEEKKLKIRDSKKMSEKARNEMFDYLKKHAHCAISIQNAERIDSIGITGALAEGVREVYNKLKNKAEITIFDGSWDPIEEDGFYTLIDADDKVKEASAASIIAKVVHDRIMYKYAEKYPEYMFEQHKGYGTKLHREMILEYGRSPIHRKTFKVKGYDDDPYRKRLIEEASIKRRMKKYKEKR